MPGNRWTLQDLLMLFICILKRTRVKLSATYCDQFSKMMRRRGRHFSGNAIRQKLMKILNEANESGELCIEGDDSKVTTPKKTASAKRTPKKKNIKKEDSSDESTASPMEDVNSTMTAALPSRRLPERTKRLSFSYRELEGDDTADSDEDLLPMIKSDVLDAQTEI